MTPPTDAMLTISPCPHSRQHRSDHGSHAEEVGLEYGVDIFLLSLLHCSQIAIASIVDEHVDAPEYALGLLTGCLI